MAKQMDSDNRQRRRVAKETKEEGESASEAGLTPGARKEDSGLRREDDRTSAGALADYAKKTFKA